MSEFNNNYHSGYEPENDSVSGSFSRPNTNSYSSSRYNSFSDSSGYTNFNQQGTANEFYYSPHKPSAGKGKKALTAIIAVLSIVALGTTSLVCYTLITGNNPVSPQTGSACDPLRCNGYPGYSNKSIALRCGSILYPFPGHSHRKRDNHECRRLYNNQRPRC